MTQRFKMPVPESHLPLLRQVHDDHGMLAINLEPLNGYVEIALGGYVLMWTRTEKIEVRAHDGKRIATRQYKDPYPVHNGSFRAEHFDASRSDHRAAVRAALANFPDTAAAHQPSSSSVFFEVDADQVALLQAMADRGWRITLNLDVGSSDAGLCVTTPDGNSVFWGLISEIILNALWRSAGHKGSARPQRMVRRADLSP